MLTIFRGLNVLYYDHLMFWVARSLAYFGFLRSAGFTVPNMSSFDPTVHLQLSDLAFDKLTDPSCIRVLIKASKTDPFRKGCHIYIGRGHFPLCAVSALSAYLHQRGDRPDPLFVLQSGQPLSREQLTSRLRSILTSTGIQGSFSSHSFRIGAATVAARNGIPDHLIKDLGRWSSNAYQGYIRTPTETLASMSTQLSTNFTPVNS